MYRVAWPSGGPHTQTTALGTSCQEKGRTGVGGGRGEARGSEPPGVPPPGPPPRCAAWVPRQAPGVGAVVLPEQLGRVASAFRAACVSCGFRPGRRACPPGARAAPLERASTELCAGGGETGALAAVGSPGRGDLGRRCWELCKTFPESDLPQIRGKASAARHPFPNPTPRLHGGLPASFPDHTRAEAWGSRGRGWRAPEGSAQASGRACRDTEGSGSLPPPRSGGIAPVGGLRVALWVARLGLKRTSPLSRATELGFSWGGEGVVETDAIFHLELGLAISSNTPGHNQGQREPTGWLKPLTAPLQLGLKGTL